jgi:hypothetical protein
MIRLLSQDLLGAEQINRFHYFCQDPKPIPDTRQKWKLDLYIQNKEREWYILGGAGRQRQGTGKPFYLNLWENLDKIDLTQSERFEHWKRKVQRIQYKFRTIGYQTKENILLHITTTVDIIREHSVQSSTNK